MHQNTLMLGSIWEYPALHSSAERAEHITSTYVGSYGCPTSGILTYTISSLIFIIFVINNNTALLPFSNHQSPLLSLTNLIV